MNGLAPSCASSLQNPGSTIWGGVAGFRTYDIRGNLVASTDEAGGTTWFLRDSVGRLVQTYGATYPSARTLDTAGRLVALGTIRAGDVWDVTQWGYDPATGLCTNKTYADGTAVLHAFTADGLPSRTTLASGRWTQNAYDADRRLSATTDSDGNSVQYAYDAFGRLASATDAAGHVETFARDALGRVTNETQTVYDELFWTNRTAVLDRPLDAFGRPAGLVVKIDGDFAQSICYDYGVDGHLSGMALTNAQGRSVSVEYDWEQGRFAGCTVFDSSGAPIFTRTQTRASRRPALVTAITNAGIQPLTSNLSSRTFSYAYDAVGRPVERGADAFAYNARGEVTNATISGATWGYAYDHIGNREAATAPSGTTAYAANALNQYTAVTGRSVAHDADGNMTRNGERNQTWDAAGRLVKSSPDLVQRWQTWQDFDYDYRGRRTAKYTQIFFGGIAPPVDTHLYFYDDWNLVHETTISDTYQIKHVDYFWGPDLSGSLQGAGGVGGLVAVSIDGDYYFPGYDNNGNVIGYWDESGSLVAEYAYDAFGNTISSSGSMASVFPHRFSTKYYDAETELYYYGYRYYSPSLGRWISRDPIEELDTPTLYGFVNNHPIFSSDCLGLFSIYIHTDGFGHVGAYTQDGTGYDYGRYRGKYHTGVYLSLEREKGPNILVKNSAWSTQTKSHSYTVFSFDVCPEIDKKVSEVFEEKFNGGKTELPQEVIARYARQKPSPLTANERYMGSDWAQNDNCKTFTFGVIARAARLASQNRALSKKEQQQANYLVMISFQQTFHNLPSGVKSMLHRFASGTDWISESTIQRNDPDD